MKRLIALVLSAALVPGIAGCSSIYSNYREVEQLLIIQVMGLDYLPGGVEISMSTAKESDSGNVSVLSAGGENISMTLEHLRNYSYEDELFYAHVNHIVIGKTAAASGIDDYLSFIFRSPELRIDVPVYILQNEEAKTLVTGAGDQQKSISEILDTLMTSQARRGESNIYTAAEISKNLARNGSALACAISYEKSAESSRGGQAAQSGESGGTPEEGAKSSGGGQKEKGGGEEGGYTAAVTGYAVIKGDAVCGYINPDISPAVGLLQNKVQLNEITVQDQYGADVTLQIFDGKTEFVSAWDGNTLESLQIDTEISATVTEIDGSGSMSGEGYESYLVAQLEAAVLKQLGDILRLSKTWNADFLGLAEMTERSAPLRYGKMEQDFAQLLPELEIRVSVSGKLRQTNDIEES